MHPIADTDDLEQRIPIPPGEAPNAMSLLRYASSLVRAAANRNWTAADAPDGVVEVVVGMVERAVRNPDGQTQETAGPFSVSFGSAAAQRVYLTRGDREIIRSGAGSGAFTIDPSNKDVRYLGGPARLHDEDWP